MSPGDAHCVSPCDVLNAPPIATDLLRASLDAIGRGRFWLVATRLRKRVLFSSRTVADALERAVSIRGTRFLFIGTDAFLSVFVLSRCAARLSGVDK